MPTVEPGARAAHPIELREEVDVQVHARRQDRVQIAAGQVRPGVADLLRRPAVIEGPSDLSRRADVHPDALRGAGRTERPEEGEERGLTLRLQREAHAMTQAGAAERALEAPDLFLDADQIMDVERGAVLARDRFGVATGDRQTPGSDLEPGAVPPRQLGGRSGHAGAQATRMAAASVVRPTPSQGPLLLLPLLLRDRPRADPPTGRTQPSRGCRSPARCPVRSPRSR